VILKLRELLGVEEMGGTMRLGTYPCVLQNETLAAKLYGREKISERHRHRYEVNNNYLDILTGHGMSVTGVYPAKNLVEIIELPDHPWFVASQFHPEFKSRPTRPAPLFRDFVGAALARARERGRVAEATAR